MKRDTKIVLTVVSVIPIFILGMSSLCSFAIANGASMKWRLAFRMMCHGLERRCLELFDVPMPICARCTGIYLGLFAGVLLFWLVPFLRERVMRNVAVAAILPLAIDGLTQLTGLRESTNSLRMATGLIAGLAFGLWILSAVERRDEMRAVSS
ncbi:MAG TPA: DUF2085 domain-containing protein [Vicinamibacterales bacterium]